MPALVLEGPDCGGKSTLAKFLVEAFGAELVKNGPDPELSASQLFEKYESQLRSAKSKTTVIDRAWPSEMVYSCVSNRPCRITQNKAESLNYYEESVSRIQSSPIVVLCLPPIEAVLAAYRKRGDAMFGEKEIALAWRLYDAGVGVPPWTIRYDWTEPAALFRLGQGLSSYGRKR